MVAAIGKTDASRFVRCRIAARILSAAEGWGRPLIMTSKAEWKAYRADLAEQLENERRFIADAESGRIALWQIGPNGGRLDTTAAHLERSKKSEKVLGGVIAKIDSDHLSD